MEWHVTDNNGDVVSTAEHASMSGENLSRIVATAALTHQVATIFVAYDIPEPVGGNDDEFCLVAVHPSNVRQACETMRFKIEITDAARHGQDPANMVPLKAAARSLNASHLIYRVGCVVLAQPSCPTTAKANDHS